MCCNPFKKEKHTAIRSSWEINLDTAKVMKIMGINIIPGDKLCPACKIEINKIKDGPCEADDDQMNTEISADSSREFLNSSFTEEDISPLKLHSVAQHSRAGYGKRKMLQIQNKLKEKQTQIKESIADVLYMDPKELDSVTELSMTSTETQAKAKDMDTMLDLMKEKIKESPRNIKIQVLTMAPASWGVGRTAGYFGVSEYMVRQAFKIRNSHGILANLEEKRGPALADRKSVV